MAAKIIDTTKFMGLAKLMGWKTYKETNKMSKILSKHYFLVILIII